MWLIRISRHRLLSITRIIKVKINSEGIIMKKTTENKKTTGKKYSMFARVMAGFLAFLMLFSVVATVIIMLVQA